MSEQLSLLYAFGRIFSPFYSVAMSLRAAFFKKGLVKQHRLPVPVVSVGNLTMGGTGKTPMTMYLAGLLSEKKPVIVSRGYGGRANDAVNVVSDGNSLLLDAKNAGDEPFHMAQRLDGVPVLTSRKRVEGGRYAVERFQAGTVILDDGFQHLSLFRDLDIVLFKVDSFLGNNRVFPGGDMREPLKALGRADCFVLTCVDEESRSRAESIKKALLNKFPEIPVFMTEYRPVSLIKVDGEEVALDGVDHLFFAFCALANPHSFENSLKLAGMKTAGFQALRDHCPYMKPELDFLKKQRKKCGEVHAYITTEKDMVKLHGKDLELPVYALRMEFVPEEGFDSFVLDRLP